MRADNSAHLQVATDRRRQATLTRATTALEDAEKSGEAVTISQVARAARVSRAWLYTQPELLERIRNMPRAGAVRPSPSLTQRASHESQARRLELAHARIRRLGAENEQLRADLARALGELRGQRILTPQPG